VKICIHDFHIRFHIWIEFCVIPLSLWEFWGKSALERPYFSYGIILNYNQTSIVKRFERKELLDKTHVLLL